MLIEGTIKLAEIHWKCKICWLQNLLTCDTKLTIPRSYYGLRILQYDSCVSCSNLTQKWAILSNNCFICMFKFLNIIPKGPPFPSLIAWWFRSIPKIINWKKCICFYRRLSFEFINSNSHHNDEMMAWCPVQSRKVNRFDSSHN